MSPSHPRIGAIVDDREHALATALDARHPDLGLSRTRLLSGDIHIIQDGRIAFVLERKTRADLRASLIDGRFASQRSRLVRDFGHERCGYVVEGGTAWSDAESGAEVALMARDRVALFWSGGVDDTADLIARLARANLVARHVPPSADGEPSASARIGVASTGSTHRSCVCMLQCIPGVSKRRAQAISARYASMCVLATAISRDRDATLDDISELKDAPSNRRFGRTLAHRVVMCIAGEDGAAHASEPAPDRILFTSLD
jgi:ERCC4-type nuclease